MALYRATVGDPHSLGPRRGSATSGPIPARGQAPTILPARRPLPETGQPQPDGRCLWQALRAATPMRGSRAELPHTCPPAAPPCRLSARSRPVTPHCGRS